MEKIVESIRKSEKTDVEIEEFCILDKRVHIVKHKDAQDSIMTLLSCVDQSENVPPHLFLYINELKCFLNC